MIEHRLGDCRQILRTLPDESVHCVVTSPPYFGLRDYGVAGQIGLEPTPEIYVAEMVALFAEVRRVLRADGTLWLNLGDSYAASGRGGNPEDSPHQKQASNRGSRQFFQADAVDAGAIGRKWVKPPQGYKAKDLIGIPWMVAFALRGDGWYLRQDIIWSKPNPMPESVRDRCTKAHEYLFLLSKSATYSYDADAISEAQTSDHTAGNVTHKGQTAYEEGSGEHRTKAGLVAFAQRTRAQTKRAVEIAEKAGLTDAHIAAIRSVGISDVGKAQVTTDGYGKNDPAVQALADEAKAALGGYYREFLIAAKRNKRSVWTVPTAPFSEAHFATFPPALIEPCILAGCPKGGTVLDPFGGAGTTGLVAHRLQRNAILIELNPEYVEMARKRIADDAPLLDATQRQEEMFG